MSEPVERNGRDGDLDAEIAEILAECSGFGTPSMDEEISEMARRYGVSVEPGIPAPPEDSRYYAYRQPPAGQYIPYGGQSYGYADPYARGPVPEYDENGGRIVFDADSPSAGSAPAAGSGYGYDPRRGGYASASSSAGTIPSAAERRKMHQQPSAGTHVLYDAETSAKTAYEAPFERFGDAQPEPEVSDGIEKSRKKKEKQSRRKKKEERKPGELTKGRRILKVFIPWNGDKPREIVRKIIMDVSFFVLFFCAIYFMNYFIELSAAIQDAGTDKGFVQDAANNQNDLAARWAEIKAKYPNVNFPEGMNIDYAELYATNQDFAGWIAIDNTNIDAPVVQGTDNSYYLKHNFRKVETKYGCSFMDYRNNKKELDQNTIIFGHHMKDNMLFAQLENYMTLDGYRASPVITFNTAYNNYKWKVFAVFVTNDQREDDNGYLFNYIVPNCHSTESFLSYLDALRERSLYDTGVDVNENDKILTLSTCSYEFTNARLVVVARMVRDGESPEVDVSKAVENESPRYPQKWYDVNGLDNPYRDAFRWEPNT